jgi:hypothetical protein
MSAKVFKITSSSVPQNQAAWSGAPVIFGNSLKLGSLSESGSHFAMSSVVASSGLEERMYRSKVGKRVDILVTFGPLQSVWALAWPRDQLVADSF